MRPANTQHAIQHIEHLLSRKLTGKRSSRVKEHLSRARQIAATIYTRFQVGPYQYQLKHLRWYLETQTEHLKPASLYRHWLTVRNIMNALDKGNEWEPQLKGCWTKP